jgi:hypothetical protein
LSNAAAIRTGKYGIGTKMIMLPIKLINKIPMYPKLSKNAKNSSILTKQTNSICPICLEVIK